MKTLYTILILLASFNALADDISLINSTTVRIRSDSPPFNSPYVDKYILFCPQKDSISGDSVFPRVQLVTYSTTPANSAIGGTYILLGSNNEAPSGDILFKKPEGISLTEGGQSMLVAETYGAAVLKSVYYNFQCLRNPSGTAIPMQLTPTALPIDQSKGYVQQQITFNGAK
jgi:hypothetical protein